VVLLLLLMLLLMLVVDGVIVWMGDRMVDGAVSLMIRMVVVYFLDGIIIRGEGVVAIVVVSWSLQRECWGENRGVGSLVFYVFFFFSFLFLCFSLVGASSLPWLLLPSLLSNACLFAFCSGTPLF
jgi:hypothetical protein